MARVPIPTLSMERQHTEKSTSSASMCNSRSVLNIFQVFQTFAPRNFVCLENSPRDYRLRINRSGLDTSPPAVDKPNRINRRIRPSPNLTTPSNEKEISHGRVSRQIPRTYIAGTVGF